MLSEPNLVRFVVRSAVEGKKGRISKKWSHMDKKSIKQFTDTCQLLWDNSPEYTQIKTGSQD
jgi:hypothetical protein